jgi:hypothetical protein
MRKMLRHLSVHKEVVVDLAELDLAELDLANLHQAAATAVGLVSDRDEIHYTEFVRRELLLAARQKIDLRVMFRSETNRKLMVSDFVESTQ